MSKTFAEGVDELKRMVGSGVLEGEISVNQVYAHYQDSGKGPKGKPAADFNHPRGGQHAYLSGQIPERRDEVMQRWANHVLTGGLANETIRLLLSFADQVFMRAPREFEVLRNSTALKLTDDHAPIYLQPAIMPRLSDAELKAIRKAAGGELTPVLKRLGSLK